MAGRLKRGQIWLLHFSRPDKRRPVLVLSRPSPRVSVSEYEQAFGSADDTILVDRLAQLSDLIGPYRSSNFRVRFVHAYDEVAKAVAAERERDLELGLR